MAARHRASTRASAPRRCSPATALISGLLVGLVVGGAPAAAAAAAATPAGTVLHAETGFGFDVADLETDHQFPGQRNTFHVSYQYRDGLHGAGFDPGGHEVAADTYPYFQDIRDRMIAFIRGYPDKTDFYEVFLGDVARDLMQRYPQLQWIDIRVDVPAFGGVPTARTGSVHMTRG